MAQDGDPQQALPNHGTQDTTDELKTLDRLIEQNKQLENQNRELSLPGTRSVEGNFPFWLGIDTRLIADEFFRPSYTSRITGLTLPQENR
jgi:hypothetical protein